MTLVSQFGTRKTIRQAVGINSGKMVLISASANGSTTTFVTTDLFGASTNTYKGRRWLGTDSPNDEVKSRVISTAVTTDVYTLTLSPAVTSTLSGDTAELWEMDPEEIGSGASGGRGFINQAIREISDKAFDPEESLALHGDGRETRLDIPSEFAEIHRIDYRTSVETEIIDEATAIWDELAEPSNVTHSQQTEDAKLGSSFRMVVATGFSTGLLATKAFTTKDLSGMDFAEFWIKCSIATSAADLQLMLDDTAECASPLETLDVPALVADTWTYVRVALANPETDTAIISVGLNYTVDIGAATIWINDVKTVLNSTAKWVALQKHLWGVDVNARDLILTSVGRARVGYSLLKLVGGDKPVLLDADATASEVDDWYVICRATALTLRAHPQEGKDPNYWDLQAERAKMKHHLPANTRKVG
ncbi:hypothetical protein LCGC14_0378420 [marine sediment metagenome]|uniref:Uncharacterized protein n=1 Tax=marine sediment metagenome TaxID=412755 RepID=A0A0F9T8P7_9ZZZZ